MSKYRKKPVVIEAFRYCVHLQPRWFAQAFDEGVVNIPKAMLNSDKEHCFIETLEGTHKANTGDWIIKGVKGELYPVKNDIFVMTYEAVENES